MEEDEKCVVHLLPFQISSILHCVQQCRSAGAGRGGGIKVRCLSSSFSSQFHPSFCSAM